LWLLEAERRDDRREEAVMKSGEAVRDDMVVVRCNGFLRADVRRRGVVETEARASRYLGPRLVRHSPLAPCNCTLSVTTPYL
jgi:uncharacterized protein (DUF427 family)